MPNPDIDLRIADHPRCVPSLATLVDNSVRPDVTTRLIAGAVDAPATLHRRHEAASTNELATDIEPTPRQEAAAKPRAKAGAGSPAEYIDDRSRKIRDAASDVLIDWQRARTAIFALRELTTDCKALATLWDLMVKTEDEVGDLVSRIHKHAEAHANPKSKTCPECGAEVRTELHGDEILCVCETEGCDWDEVIR